MLRFYTVCCVWHRQMIVLKQEFTVVSKGLDNWTRWKWEVAIYEEIPLNQKVLVGLCNSYAVLLRADNPILVIHTLLRWCLGTQTQTVLTWFLNCRESPRNKPAGDRANEVNSTALCKARKKHLCKTLGLHCCLHHSFPYKFSNRLEASVETLCAEHNPFKAIISWRIS